MEKVRVYKWELVKDSEEAFRGVRERVFETHALFHQYGIDYTHENEGIGQFTTAIVVLPNGSILNTPVELVEFVVSPYAAYFGMEDAQKEEEMT